jgi:hypothetical protein
MTDRLITAYSLMLLMAVWIGSVAWWKLHHSDRRTRARQLAARRKKDLARAPAIEEGSVKP